LYRIRMDSTAYLPTQTVMMESPKNALVTPNCMHLRKIEFLPLSLSEAYPIVKTKKREN